MQPQPTDQRNRAIAHAILDGASILGVAQQHGITRQRVHQIFLRWCKFAHPALFDAKPEKGVMQWLREQKHLFRERVADIRIDDLQMSPRSRNALRRERVITLGDLAKCSPKQLSRFLNLGKTSLAEINELLAKHCLTLQPNPPGLRRPQRRATSKWPPFP